MMMNTGTLLSQTFLILHSCLSVILAPYLLDVLYARLIHFGMGPLAVIAIIPLKVYVFAGLCGALAEVVSGEEIVLRLKNVRKNADRFWKLCLLWSLIPFAVHFVWTLSGMNVFHVPIYAVYAHLNLIILYGMAHYIFRAKYLPQPSAPAKPVHMSAAPLRMMAQLFGLYVLSVAVFDLPYIYPVDSIDITRFTLLVYYYILFAMYVFILLVYQSRYPKVVERFGHGPEIYLINPAGGGLLFHLASMVTPLYPPVFVVIKALTPKKYKFREFNQVPWQQRYYAPGKLVAITCFTSNSPDCYRIASEFRRRGSKVVLGGPHVTFLPEEALEYCDSVVVGELENVWEELIQDYENGSLKPKYSGAPLKDCHDLIHQELLNSPPEVIKDFLETSRGCKFKCHFCSVPAVSGGSLRTKPVFDVVELIEKIKHKYRSIRFIDNNIYSDPAYTKELFKALKPLNVKWATQCTIDIAKNDDLLKLAKESGCSGLLIGFEISESSTEKQAGGKLGMAQKYREYAQKIKALGIGIKAHFIFGFEPDRFRDLFNFWKFCFAIQPDVTVISVLTPFPGTKVYDEMTRDDAIVNLNWKYYGCQAMVFEHKKMNSALLATLWPVINIIFLLTTSRLGYGILLLSIVAGYMVIIK